MLNSKKIAAAAGAGVLGGFALIGVGAGQAFADDSREKCVGDGRGQLRCEYVKKRNLVSDTLEYFGVVVLERQS